MIVDINTGPIRPKLQVNKLIYELHVVIPLTVITYYSYSVKVKYKTYERRSDGCESVGVELNYTILARWLRARCERVGAHSGGGGRMRKNIILLY